MKRNILFLIAVFMLSIVAPVSAQSRKDKKAAKKAEWEMEQQRKKEEAELLHQMRMDSIRAIQESRDAARKQAEQHQRQDEELKSYELEMKKLTLENAKKSMAKRVGQKLFTPCVDESYDLPGEYMAGLGIAEGCRDREEATIKANQIAITDITTRYIGVIKNVVTRYNKDTDIPSNKKISEKKLEGISEVVGTNIIEKHANVVCREFTQDATGAYVGYLAIHVLVDDLQKGLKEELDVRKVDYDAEKLMKSHEAELSDAYVRKRAELDTLK